MARFTEWFEELNNSGKFKGGGPLGHYGKILAGRNPASAGKRARRSRIGLWHGKDSPGC